MTDHLTLQRVAMTVKGAYGVLVHDGQPLCVTLENPWHGNQRNISCIPPGQYTCVRHHGAKYKNVWRLENVPGRTAILIHAGNTVRDTQGCILVGTSFYSGGISQSVNALDKLRLILRDTFTLTVLNPSEGNLP